MTPKKTKPVDEPLPVEIKNADPVKTVSESKSFGLHNDIWKVFITTLGTLLVTWMTLEIQAGRKEQEKTTIAVEENGRKVGDRLNEIGKVVDDTHTLSNANMGTSLKVSADAARLVATMRKGHLDAYQLEVAKDATKHDPAKVASKVAELESLLEGANKVAENAELALAEHEAKQAIVDAGQKIEMNPRPKPGKK